jgi:hypothetical protein
MRLLGGSKKGSRGEPRRRQLSADAAADKRSAKRGQTLFRRNRTLVGSLSAQVASASELTGDLQSPRAHTHHLMAHRRFLGTVLLLVVGAICFLLWLIYEFTAGIQVAPTANIVVDSARYERAIGDYFAAHPFERLRVLLNEGELTKYLTEVTPEVKQVQSGGASGFATSEFDITFRRPVVGWLIGAKQYYVDDSGVSFQQNYFAQPSVKIVDQSGVPQVAGTQVASSRFLRFVGQAITLAKSDGLTITQAIIPANTTHEIALLVSGHTYPIKLSLDRPVGEQIEDMYRALKYFDGKGEKPQYVDIRVSGKAYYK